MIVTHISTSIPSRRHREASWACSRPNASTCLVVGRPWRTKIRDAFEVDSLLSSASAATVTLGMRSTNNNARVFVPA